jgi:hypothetical protein
MWISEPGPGTPPLIIDTLMEVVQNAGGTSDAEGQKKEMKAPRIISHSSTIFSQLLGLQVRRVPSDFVPLSDSRLDSCALRGHLLEVLD